MNGQSLGDLFTDSGNENYIHPTHLQRTRTNDSSVSRNLSTSVFQFDTDDELITRMRKVIKSYEKLKICFIILLLFNAALVVMYVLTNGTFSLHDEQKQQALYENIVTYIDSRLPADNKQTFRVCSKYKHIFESSKLTVPAMSECKSKYSPEYCCFESTDQLFSLFHEVIIFSYIYMCT